jgi:hypothetical protein
MPLRLPLLFFQIVDSRVSPLCFSVFDGRKPDFIKKLAYFSIQYIRYLPHDTGQTAEQPGSGEQGSLRIPIQ